MEATDAFPFTTESHVITGADISGLTEATPAQRAWFLNAEGLPIAHPNLPDGHVLVCQLEHADGTTTTTICNSKLRMTEEYEEVIAGSATAIRWYTGPVSSIKLP